MQTETLEQATGLNFAWCLNCNKGFVTAAEAERHEDRGHLVEWGLDLGGEAA